uniref:Uncharacterized protein n=1 Tax=Anguilla anguilla TaxID=7936 RepID=A0A0E9RAP6_ANGAN
MTSSRLLVCMNAVSSSLSRFLSSRISWSARPSSNFFE